jgi:hypothetical protein
MAGGLPRPPFYDYSLSVNKKNLSRDKTKADVGLVVNTILDVAHCTSGQCRLVRIRRDGVASDRHLCELFIFKMKQSVLLLNVKSNLDMIFL